MTSAVVEGMQTWTFDHVRPPGEGPWNDEPDKAQWVDKDSGLDCLAVRGELTGAWCGYVGLPPGHLWHGKDYHELYPEPAVHGGVNYSALCREDTEGGYGICHVPLPGRPEQVWWLGFHCATGHDYSPTEAARLDEYLSVRLRDEMFQKYRTFDYVVAQVTLLAAQLRIEALRP